MSLEKLERVFTEGTLIQVNVARWSGLKYLDAEDLGLKSEDIDSDLFSLGRKRLLSKSRMQSFKSIENRARKTVDKYSFPFPLGKAAFIPAAAIPKVIEELDKHIVDFDGATETLVKDYEDVKKAMIGLYQNNLPSIYERLGDAVDETFPEFSARFLDKIARAYPQDIKSRYSLSYSMFRVSMPEDARAEAIETGVAAEVAEQKAKLIAKKNKEMQKRINEDVDDFVVKVVGALRGEVSEVCGRVSELIARGAPVKETSLGALRDMVEKFKTLNFMGDEEINSQIEEVKSLLDGKSSADFRSDDTLLADLGDSLKKASSSARRQVELSEIVENFGGAGQRILREED